MVELLLKAGADPNTPLPGGETALMTARARTRYRIVFSFDVSRRALGLRPFPVACQQYRDTHCDCDPAIDCPSYLPRRFRVVVKFEFTALLYGSVQMLLSDRLSASLMTLALLAITIADGCADQVWCRSAAVVAGAISFKGVRY